MQNNQIKISGEVAGTKSKSAISSKICFWIVRILVAITYYCLLDFVRNFTVGPQTQILMLIAEEVGTESKWAIPPELYFQMAPAAQVYTFSEHILHFGENITHQKFPSPVTCMII